MRNRHPCEINLPAVGTILVMALAIADWLVVWSLLPR